MRQSSAEVVRGKDGFRGTVVPAFQHALRDAGQVLVQLESGQQFWCLLPPWCDSRMEATTCR